VLLAQELPDRALGLLERLHTLAVAQQRTGSLIEIQALQALALAGDGDEPGGVAALRAMSASDKLGAANRTEAVTRARELGLLG
jgi:MalT-like TPR region